MNISALQRRYFALGVFVQEFEFMVHATRETIIPCIEAPIHNEMMIKIVLTNRAMTAQPLFEAMRGVIGERLRYNDFPKAKEKILYEIIGQISKEYDKLVRARNILLHGTWWPNHSDGSLAIHKFRGTLSQGIGLTDAPASALEFIRLARRCREQAAMIFGLVPTVMEQADNFDPENHFFKERDVWKSIRRVSLAVR